MVANVVDFERILTTRATRSVRVRFILHNLHAAAGAARILMALLLHTHTSAWCTWVHSRQSCTIARCDTLRRSTATIYDTLSISWLFTGPGERTAYRLHAPLRCVHGDVTCVGTDSASMTHVHCICVHKASSLNDDHAHTHTGACLGDTRNVFARLGTSRVYER
jgi:hypothetical protein